MKNSLDHKSPIGYAESIDGIPSVGFCSPNVGGRNRHQ